MRKEGEPGTQKLVNNVINNERGVTKTIRFLAQKNTTNIVEKNINGGIVTVP